ncbi:LysR family transcriptional regulator [Roseivivax sp. CAU 1761]
MDNWDDLRFLVALSKTGTMTAAAKLLGTNTATVSRRIERLSESLGTPAFIKTADGWKPSDSVKRLIDIAQDFDGTLQTVMNERSAATGAESVTLHIGSVPIVTNLVLMPGLKRHADMLEGISLVFADRVFREGLGENDLVIMYGQPESGRIVTRKAGELTFRLYHFRDQELPADWVGLGEAHDAYPPMQMGLDLFQRPPKMRVDNFTALYSLMTVSGLPGPLPDRLAAQNPDLAPLFPDRPPFSAEFWLIFHETRRADPAMRRAVEWITRCFEDLSETALPTSAEA